MDSTAWFSSSYSELELLLFLWALRVTSAKCLKLAEMSSNIGEVVESSARLVRDLEHRTFKVRLRVLSLFFIWPRGVQGEIVPYSYLKDSYKLLTVADGITKPNISPWEV